MRSNYPFNQFILVCLYTVISKFADTFFLNHASSVTEDQKECGLLQMSGEKREAGTHNAFG
jgi:hypothetical protein